MKHVGRRLTYKRRTRAPWSWRPVWAHTAPRVCLSHHVDPVFLDPAAPEPKEIGKYDWLLRLYQHEGASPASVQQPGGVGYFEQEWQTIRDKEVEWLEYVNRHARTTYRIDFGTALRYGSWESTPRGDMWVVPVEQYTTVTL